MKIRNGFVSNSSSCSFILRFPKGVKLTLEQFKSWFQIKDNLIAQGLMKRFEEGSHEKTLLSKEEILEILDYYMFAGSPDESKIRLFCQQIDDSSSEFEFIGFVADDHYENPSIFTSGELAKVLTGRNIYVINEH